MVIFHSYVKLPEGSCAAQHMTVYYIETCETWVSHWMMHDSETASCFFQIGIILGKLQEITNLKSSAIEGDDFPFKNHDFQASVAGPGR